MWLVYLVSLIRNRKWLEVSLDLLVFLRRKKEGSCFILTKMNDEDFVSWNTVLLTVVLTLVGADEYFSTGQSLLTALQ
jgi:hypothetical protein